MQDIFARTAAFAAAAVTAAMLLPTAVSAADVTLDADYRTSDGQWQDAVEYNTAIISDNTFDPTDMTPQSEVIFRFECASPVGEKPPAELIWQTWGAHKTAVSKNWNRIKPYEFGDGYAKFSYEDIVAEYGTDDFSEVYTILVTDTGTPITAKSITITNVDDGTSEAHEDVTDETEKAEETSESTAENTAESTVSEKKPEETTETVSETTAAVTEHTAQTEQVPEQKQNKKRNVKWLILSAAAAALLILSGVIAAVLKREKDKKNRLY